MTDLDKKVLYYKQLEQDKLKREIEEQSKLDNINTFLREIRNEINNKTDYHTSTNYNNIIDKLKGRNIYNDEIISVMPNSKSGHRQLKVKCLLCGEERVVKSKNFFADRPQKEGMCNCKKYAPKPDNRYVDTIRGYDIYVGLGEKQEGCQKLWVKCLKCNQYRKVNAEDYLEYKCIKDCKHIVSEEKISLDFNDFKKIDKYYSMNSFNIGDVLNNGNDIFIGYDNSNGRNIFAVLKCNKCGKVRKIIINEFLKVNNHTLVYSMCECFEKRDVKIGGIYGNLKVMSFDNKRKCYKCICLCESNKIVYREKYKLLSGLSLSCGCLSKELKSKYNCIDYIGATFNNLVVKDFYKLKDSHSKKYIEKGIYWLCKCKLCGKEILLPSKHVVSNVITNCGCKNKRFFETFKIGDFVDDLEIRDIIKLKGVGTFWSVKCPFCNNNFVRLASNICKSHYKSCGCLKRSYGELIVLNILRRYNLKFNEQVSFKELKNGTLRFDFLINKNNNIYLIEYDGLEHYSEDNQFGSKKENFERIQYNDGLKNDFAKLKGIPLLRIPYILDKEKIENLIKKFMGGF